MSRRGASTGARGTLTGRDGDVLRAIAEQVERAEVTNIVLDDDPTGTQSVYDVPLLTTWSEEDLRWALTHPSTTVFVLTNTRSMSADAAWRINFEIATALVHGSKTTGRDFVLTSRSDSTLRGHFPVETDALQAGLRDAGAAPIDGVIVCPAFFQARRVTVDDIQWVGVGAELVPVANTPYAQDRSFGFASSNLRDWIAERSGEHVSRDEVVSITLEEIRDGGSEVVCERLYGVDGGGYLIVNAEQPSDLETFVLGLLAAERAGKRFLYRTGPSFPCVRGGLDGPRLVERTELFARRPTRRHGLVVVGSHVPTTTRQLEVAAALGDIELIELSVPRLLGGEGEGEMNRVLGLVRRTIPERDVIVYTSRTLATGGDGANAALGIARAVSDAIVELVGSVDLGAIGWLVAKGGITSSDIATRALGVRRATVAGTLLEPGIVPVWLLPEGGAAAGMPFVIFPGNVGDDEALADAVLALRATAEAS